MARTKAQNKHKVGTCTHHQDVFRLFFNFLSFFEHIICLVFVLVFVSQRGRSRTRRSELRTPITPPPNRWDKEELLREVPREVTLRLDAKFYLPQGNVFNTLARTPKPHSIGNSSKEGGRRAITPERGVALKINSRVSVFFFYW